MTRDWDNPRPREVHTAAQSRTPDGPRIGILTCKMIDGTLWLFDEQGRHLDMVTSIQINQAVNDVTTATVVLLIDMERDDVQQAAPALNEKGGVGYTRSGFPIPPP